MFNRIALIDRGEPAVRLIRAVREMNQERGGDTVVIAVHGEAEQRALFVRLAHESACLRSVDSSRDPYLDHESLERALRASRADAVWVGSGLAAEDPGFAGLCERLGLIFIGPPAEALRQLGDKIEARFLAEKTGIPLARWSAGPVSSMADAVREADAIGYPLVVKSASGGGRGIRVVTSADGLRLAFDSARAEADVRFGDPVVFMESFIDRARHIEVPVIADAHGTIWAPGVRDCSIRRRTEKLVEESGPSVLGDEQRATLRAASIALMSAGGHQGVGTVEYLYQPEDDTFVFLGVDTGQPVEHAVTELTTGLDLVKLQLLIAAGEKLTGATPVESGHAIQVRLSAKDANDDFAPAPGTIAFLNLPHGPGIRVDTGIAPGEVILGDYDPMVAKVIAWGRDRREALARLRCALHETTVLIAGGTTTKSFLIGLLDRPEVISGGVDTQWLDAVFAELAKIPAKHAGIALLSAAIDMFESRKSSELASFLESARGGRPRAGDAVARGVELSYNGRTYGFVVAQVGPHRYRLKGRGRLVVVDVARLNAYETQVTMGIRRYLVSRVPGESSQVVDVEGFSHRVTAVETGLVRAPAPAVVVAIRVKPGDEVEAGASLAVLESMKMETAVRAPRAGIVREVFAVVNSHVDVGVPLLRLGPLGETVDESDGSSVDFENSDNAIDGTRNRALTLLADLHSLVTGYAISAKRGQALIADYVRARAAIEPGDLELLHGEVALMTAFADVCDLSRNRPAAEEESVDEQVHSPREHFHTYLHSLDVEREKLPESFQLRLCHALRHYGVTDLAPSPELEEAVYRLYLAQLGATDIVPVIAILLERWLGNTESLTGPACEQIGEVIDGLVKATQLRYPVIGDLARRIRFQLFEQPRIQQSRERAHAVLREHLDYLDEHPEAADRPDRVEAMVALTEPLVRVLASRIAAKSGGPEPLLEVLTRRYYKVRTLEDVKSFLRDDRQFVTGGFELRGQRLHLISTVTDFNALPAVLESLSILAQDVAEPANLVVDLYLSWNGAPADTDEVSTILRLLLADVPLVTTGRRVTVTVFEDASTNPRQVTFRPSKAGVQEDRVIRNMHPLTGQRLNLWRLKNFNGTRLPSAEDTYLFHCVAKDNPADERLVAMAEIREVNPLRDLTGNITAFPAIERALAGCLDSMRRHQAQEGQQRLDANLIFLDIWPTIECSSAELAASARAVAPLTGSAGLEEIMVVGRLRDEVGQEPRDVALVFSYRPASGITVSISTASTEPVPQLDAYTQKVRRSRSRGTTYPYELVPQLTGASGVFIEHDVDSDGRLVPVERPPGRNTSGIIVGVVRTPTIRYPEGMTRVALFGDPTKALGSVAEAECSRIIAALDLAEQMRVPLEWFALSSGAEISMARGTENMDWVARALRRLITFTQNGGEVNVVVAGINVGAQPYWNAEATMLMHTKGILVMTPDSAMVLTGKQSLDYSGGVSAEDNFGIGGYDRVMGPNGQAQYWAPNLSAACNTLFAHYDYTYIAPGESSPRRGTTTDPRERDVCAFPHQHPSSDFKTVGDIFSASTNRERKKPFDIRTVMRAVVDQDHAVLERWSAMADAATVVVLDAYLGGYPVMMLGIESRPILRSGAVPADGPDTWTAGTLFPFSAKKAARAINAASGNRPLVVVANLSGFDGSPESLRKVQLEYGAEIGRAIVNFDGPIVFSVISRYHGGAFVVFSGVLNDNMEIVAVEGSFASVIGGAPAAAVVFAREVNSRTTKDPRIVALTGDLAQADEVHQAELRVELANLRATVRSEKLGQVAEEFEHVHNIERALAVGSVHAIIGAHELRPFLIGAVERGIAREVLGTRSKVKS